MLLVEVVRVFVVVVRVVERGLAVEWCWRSVLAVGLVSEVERVVELGLFWVCILALVDQGFELPADAGKVPPLAESPLAARGLLPFKVCEQLKEGIVGNISERHIHCFVCMETSSQSSISEKNFNFKDFKKIFGKT